MELHPKFWEFTLRLSVAFILGAIIGLDRTYRAKDAGFRTHILVSVGSALMMIISQYGFEDFVGDDAVRYDPARIAAQVVSGIGFIGAGTIILQKHIVRGLTTAAGLWATAGIGLAVGSGMYSIGIVTAVLTLLGLELFPFIFKKVGIHTLSIQYSTSIYSNIKNINDEVSRCNGRLISYSAEKIGSDANASYRVNIIIRSINAETESHIINYIQQQPEVLLEKVD
ncbi:MAG: MgtC/SapB family protein [Muribaculaceae bacterium]|nr:MgtC/SapB family protein [Muribaculaceae bacterium]